MKNEMKHTAHSSYRCEYHIVFASKYRRKVIYRELKKDIGEILRKLCNEMKVEIIERVCGPVHGKENALRQKRQPLEAAACNSDAMVNPQYPFEGSASTDSSRV